ncbi:MAG: ATP-binding protein [Patescibacteria group bacterium]|nr:ATP-binding protein [Patescibacteria group bacterium]
MREFSDNILRPLINLEKNEIKNYLEENNLKYFEDETNKDTKITRNKIRHDILPGFKDVNSKYKSNINNFINYLEEVKNHLDKQVEDFLYEQGVKVFNSGKYKINTLDIYGYFYIKDFLNLSSLLQKEIIKNIYFKTNNKSTI